MQNEELRRVREENVNLTVCTKCFTYTGFNVLTNEICASLAILINRQCMKVLSPNHIAIVGVTVDLYLNVIIWN